MDIEDWEIYLFSSFFGMISVVGSSFLQLKVISTPSILLSLVLGLLSVAVLNLNNMRDRESDAAVGKGLLLYFWVLKAQNIITIH